MEIYLVAKAHHDLCLLTRVSRLKRMQLFLELLVWRHTGKKSKRQSRTTQVGHHTSDYISDNAIIYQIGLPLDVTFLMYHFLFHCFSCFNVNDIHRCSNKFKFHLLADDTDILYTDRNVKNLKTIVNIELKNPSSFNWLRANKLTFNICFNIKKSTLWVLIHTKSDLLTNQDIACLIMKRIIMLVLSLKSL